MIFINKLTEFLFNFFFNYSAFLRKKTIIMNCFMNLRKYLRILLDRIAEKILQADIDINLTI